ncbi:hypothetical protein ACIHFE_24770 [Streptomyces sp. NPDC052396]|uniref:hypothetical protein n=1 Tax=Streptomyces sp. NPDC052396 TaxID=3365689 RepID=UPI0037D272E0
MTAQHSGLTPDLPPIVEVPDLPGAEDPGPAAGRGEEMPSSLAGSGHGSGAHQEGDGRHGCAADGSGG